MADVALGKFARALAGVERVGVDTPVLIYHLEDVRPHSELTTYLFARAAGGAVQLVVSTISVGEILVGAWRTGNGESAARIDGALQAVSGLQAADVTWEAARRGAELRGHTNLPLPDALIIASVIEQGAQAIVTNDAAWRLKQLPRRVLVLDDYVGSE